MAPSVLCFLTNACLRLQAASNGHVECCRLLLVEGQANVNVVAKFGITALHLATSNGHKAVVRLLLKHGAKELPISGGGVTVTPSEFVNIASRVERTAEMRDLAEYMNRKHCKQCDKLADTKACSRCKSVQYCSRECQKKHWKVHKPDCKTAA